MLNNNKKQHIDLKKYSGKILAVLPLYIYHEFKPIANTYLMVNFLLNNGFKVGDLIMFNNELKFSLNYKENSIESAAPIKKNIKIQKCKIK
jgi:hypothetical protein